MRRPLPWLLSLLLLLTPLLVSADAPGQWGRVVPIADNAHPNLFWNQSEINQLRQMVLVDHSPAYLYNAYRDKMQGLLADPSYDTLHNRGFFVGITYMLEPTQAKANAIRSALLTYQSQNPSGIPHWYSAACFCGWPLALWFDLIQAYHPNTLSTSEKNSLKAYFKLSADAQKVDSNNPQLVTGSGNEDPGPPITREGKSVQEIPNWYTREMGMAGAFVLLGGTQADVDFWFDSGWPHTLFTFDGVTPTFPPDTQNRYDMITSILAMYPSGADVESYTREGLNMNDNPPTWHTQQFYSHGAYHLAQQTGAYMGALMAWHNGMTQVWTIVNEGNTVPNLLRNMKRALASRNERDTADWSCCNGLAPGFTMLVGYEPMLMLGQRFYPSDSTIQQGMPGVINATTEVINWEFPREAGLFLGNPTASMVQALPSPTNLRITTP